MDEFNSEEHCNNILFEFQFQGSRGQKKRGRDSTGGIVCDEVALNVSPGHT